MGNAGEEGPKQCIQPVEVVLRQQPAQPDSLLHVTHGVRQHRGEQTLVEALAHFPVRIAQPVEETSAKVLRPGNREITGLKQ